jgi:hypothetical protein
VDETVRLDMLELLVDMVDMVLGLLSLNQALVLSVSQNLSHSSIARSEKFCKQTFVSQFEENEIVNADA